MVTSHPNLHWYIVVRGWGMHPDVWAARDLWVSSTVGSCGRNTSSRLLRRGYEGQLQQRRAPAPRRQNSSSNPEIDFDKRRDDEYAKMESASKRKAGNAALSPGDGRPAKRARAPVRARPNKCAMVLAVSRATCGEVQAVFGALRAAQLDMGAMLPSGSTYGQQFTPPSSRRANTRSRCDAARVEAKSTRG